MVEEFSQPDPNSSMQTVDENENCKKSVKDRVLDGSINVLLICPQGLKSRPKQLDNMQTIKQLMIWNS